jgi:hypothetical protein
MDEEFYRQQALRVRDLAGKADPTTNDDGRYCFAVADPISDIGVIRRPTRFVRLAARANSQSFRKACISETLGERGEVLRSAKWC